MNSVQRPFEVFQDPENPQIPSKLLLKKDSGFGSNLKKIDKNGIGFTPTSSRSALAEMSNTVRRQHQHKDNSLKKVIKNDIEVLRDSSAHSAKKLPVVTITTTQTDAPNEEIEDLYPPIENMHIVSERIIESVESRPDPFLISFMNSIINSDAEMKLPEPESPKLEPDYIFEPAALEEAEFEDCEF